MSGIQWRLASPAPAAEARLRQTLGLSRVLAQVLAARGWTDPGDAREFLAPAFRLAAEPVLPGIEDALKVIRQAKRNRKTVAVYGDYDVDGVAATTVLREALSQYGFGRRRTAGRGGGQIRFHIPSRTVDGYGLNADAVKSLAQDGVEVLVTVDCGVSANREIELARSFGMQVVVTDHHQPPPVLPPAEAIVNPWLAPHSGQGPRAAEPCGAMVALQLAQALLGEVKEEWLDLVALATVADIVPLVGANRGLVSTRLPLLRATRNPGLQALIGRCGLGGRELDAHHLAFALAPRINALGRVGLGLGASDAVRAFSTELPLEAEELAVRMDEANRMRQELEAQVAAEALAAVAADGPVATDAQAGQLPAATVVAGRGWHPGVLGIVASRLASRFWRPAAVISIDDDGSARGSARAVPGYNLYEALLCCRSELDEFGGHSQAAGFGLRQERIGDFRTALCKAVEAQGSHSRYVDLEAVVSLGEVDDRLVEDVRRIEPFGHSNPAPVLGALGCEVLSARRVGNGKHLKLALRQAGVVREAIGFGMGDTEAGRAGSATAAPFQPGDRIDAAFTPERHEWNGRSYVQLKLTDVRPATPVEASILGGGRQQDAGDNRMGCEQ